MSDHRKRLHRHYYRRYFEEYFGPKLLSEITPEFAESYWPWRRSYWANHPRLIAYNPKRKGAKTTVCQTACNLDPRSASNFDPSDRELVSH